MDGYRTPREIQPCFKVGDHKTISRKKRGAKHEVKGF